MKYPSPAWTKAATILEVIIGAIMCTLVICRFITQSLQMYRATKQWRVSGYMNLLVQQGIVYFLAYVPLSSFHYPPLPAKFPNT